MEHFDPQNGTLNSNTAVDIIPFGPGMFQHIDGNLWVAITCFALLALILMFLFSRQITEKKGDFGPGGSPNKRPLSRFEYFYCSGKMSSNDLAISQASTSFSLGSLGLIIVLYFPGYVWHISALAVASVAGYFLFYIAVTKSSKHLLVDEVDSIGMFFSNQTGAPYIGKIVDAISFVALLSVLIVEVFVFGLLVRVLFNIAYYDIIAVSIMMLTMCFYIGKRGMAAARLTDYIQFILTLACLAVLMGAALTSLEGTASLESTFGNPHESPDPGGATSDARGAVVRSSVMPPLYLWIPFVALLQITLPFGNLSMLQRLRATANHERATGLKWGIIYLSMFVLGCLGIGLALHMSGFFDASPQLNGSTHGTEDEFESLITFIADDEPLQGATICLANLVFIVLIGFFASSSSTADSAMLALCRIFFSGSIVEALGEEQDSAKTIIIKWGFLCFLSAAVAFLYWVLHYHFERTVSFESIVVLGMGASLFTVFVPQFIFIALKQRLSSFDKKTVKNSVCISLFILSSCFASYLVKTIFFGGSLSMQSGLKEGLTWSFSGGIIAFLVSLASVAFCIVKK